MSELISNEDKGDNPELISELEEWIVKLIDSHTKLREENNLLQQQNQTLVSENSTLVERNRQVKGKVMSLLDRLKNMSDVDSDAL